MADKFIEDTTKSMVSHLKNDNVDEHTKMSQFVRELQQVRTHDQGSGRNFHDDVNALNESLHKAGVLGGMTIVENGKDVSVSKDASGAGILRDLGNTAMDGVHAVADTAVGAYKLVTGDFSGAGSKGIDVIKDIGQGVYDEGKTTVDTFKTIFGM